MFDDQKLAVLAAVDGLAEVAEQKVTELQNQVDTANLQHQNDQQAIQQSSVLLSAANAKITELQSVKVYDRLESKPFRSNPDKSVGGSGLGSGGWKAPGIECAELWVLDQAGIPAPNYVDVYNTQDFPADPTKTRFRLEGSWMFPTAADLKACQCLEWEARQVFHGHMFIFAGQLQYSGGNLRYFDDLKKWTSTGTKITKPAPLQWVRVALEGYRVAVPSPETGPIPVVQYVSMELDGVKIPLGFNYVAQPTNWKEGLLRIGLQLDDSGAVDGYRVKIDDWKLTVTQ